MGGIGTEVGGTVDCVDVDTFRVGEYCPIIELKKLVGLVVVGLICPSVDGAFVLGVGVQASNEGGLGLDPVTGGLTVVGGVIGD